MIKYSLFIPHYNDFTRLERMLSSIPLGRKEIEIIVVDDCSPDEMSYRLFRERWPSIITLRSERNRGAGAARNIGMDSAAGQYIVFGDADDEFLEDAFDTFDESINDTLDMVYFLSEAVQETTGEESIRGDAYNKLSLDYIDDSNSENLHKLKVGHYAPIAKVYSNKISRSYKIEI